MTTKMSDLSSDAMTLIEAMKGQLIIALIRRLGGKVSMPVEEIDATGDVNLLMEVDGATLNFEVVDK